MNNFSQNFIRQPPPPVRPIKIVHYLLTSRKHDLQGMIERPELFILEERAKGLCDDNLRVHKRAVEQKGICYFPCVLCIKQYVKGLDIRQRFLNMGQNSTLLQKFMESPSRVIFKDRLDKQLKQYTVQQAPPWAVLNVPSFPQHSSKIHTTLSDTARSSPNRFIFNGLHSTRTWKCKKHKNAGF